MFTKKALKVWIFVVVIIALLNISALIIDVFQGDRAWMVVHLMGLGIAVYIAIGVRKEWKKFRTTRENE